MAQLAGTCTLHPTKLSTQRVLYSFPSSTHLSTTTCPSRQLWVARHAWAAGAEAAAAAAALPSGAAAATANL
eukprot:1161850-Pelagomonas_calceolata.AAC.4